jgi:hypothetical protein
MMWRSKSQSTPSSTTTEAEVKAMTLCVEACKKILDLWAEIARVEHGIMRIVCDSEGAIAQAVNGQDHKRSATYKRSQFYVEHAASQGMVWFGAVPGTINPADVFTKLVRNHVEFNDKIRFSLLESRAVPAQVSFEDPPPFPCALSRDMLPHSPHRPCEVIFLCFCHWVFSRTHTAPACGRGRVDRSSDWNEAEALRKCSCRLKGGSSFHAASVALKRGNTRDVRS